MSWSTFGALDCTIKEISCRLLLTGKVQITIFVLTLIQS